MANIKITDLDAYTNPDSTDVLPIVDVGEDETKKVSIADLMENAGSGTDALPGISFDGDPDTGMSRPGANQLGFSTGGTRRMTISDSGAVTIPGALTVEGNATFEGTTTFIDSTNLQVEDKNIELGKVGTPTDTTANGGGITLLGDSDHTITWTNSTDSWDFSEHVNIASGKEFKIAGTSVLSATTLGSGVTSSSLTSVGTIGTGTWQGTPIATAYIADDAVNADKLNDTTVTAGSYTAADITVDAQGRITAAANGTVGSAEIADDAIGPDQLADTAVTAGSYTAADITVDAQGRITSAASGTISTTEIADDAVTAAKLADTAVTAGSYTAADITVDAQGRITSAANGSVSVTFPIDGGDNDKILLGTGDDLEIYHNGTDSVIDNKTGDLYLKTQADDNDIYLQCDNGSGGLANYLYCDGSEGTVNLSHYSSTKLSTTSTGIDVTGTVVADGLNVDSNTLYVDATNNRVGIGTTSVNRPLHISGSGTQAVLVGSTNAGSALLILDGDSNGDGTGSDYAYIRHGTDGDLDLVNSKSGVITFSGVSSEAARIDSSGRLLVGTSSASSTDNDANFPYFQLEGVSGDTSRAMLRCNGGTGQYGAPILYLSRSRGSSDGAKTSVANNDMLGEVLFLGADGADDRRAASIRAFVDGTPGSNDMPGRLVFSTTADTTASPTARMTIKSTGNVGIGTESPSSPINTGRLMVQGGDIVVRDDQSGNAWRRGALVFDIRNSNGDSKAAYIRGGRDSDISSNIKFFTTVSHSLAERMRIDDSGRLLVGTTSARSGAGINCHLQVEGTGATDSSMSLIRNSNNAAPPYLVLGKSRGTALNSNTVVQSGDILGSIEFAAADGNDIASQAAYIRCYVDATPGSNDTPGRLVFGTTADGASSPTERMRISDGGHVLPGSNNAYDLGSSSRRWRNVYTNDLNLSNEGSANDVDGTWGNYTIQEGEDDLFLINRRNGKKYKFNLTEVN